MKNAIQLSSFVRLIFVYSFITSAITFVSPFAFGQASGSFTLVKGSVELISKEGKATKAKVGLRVLPSDTISSSEDSRAKIVMSDKNIINISPNTRVKLETYIYDEKTNNKQVSLYVEYGKVRATVQQKYDGEKNKFHVKTPSAVAGVRGTDFITSFDKPTRQTEIVTFEGRVAVGLPGPQGAILNPVFVNAGLKTLTVNGEAPIPPIKVPAPEFNQLREETMNDPSLMGAASSGPKSESKNEDKPEAKEREPANEGMNKPPDKDMESKDKKDRELPDKKSSESQDRGEFKKKPVATLPSRIFKEPDFKPPEEPILINMPKELPIGTQVINPIDTNNQVTNEQIRQIIQTTTNPAKVNIIIQPQ